MSKTLKTLMVAIAAILLTMPQPQAVPARQDYSDWSEPVHLGPLVNARFVSDEFGATISKDGLSLYFTSARPGGFGGTDIWVSQRATAGDPWEAPLNLGPAVNSESNDALPRLSLDGHRLYFNSTRPGGFGGNDLYVSRRHNQDNDLSWEQPENLGSGVNSPANDVGAAVFEDGGNGTMVLYFQSNRPGGPGLTDIYASTLQADDMFGPAVLVAELSSPFGDNVPCVRRDGLEVLINSNRPGSMPFPSPFTGRSFDLWVSTRESTAHPWSLPINLGPVVNTDFNDGWAALSFDGTALYYSTSRPAEEDGTLDFYVSTRSKLHGGWR